MYNNKFLVISVILIILLLPDTIAETNHFDSSLLKINDYEYKPSQNLIKDVSYQNVDDSYNMIIEIPSGTLEKWQTNESNGNLYIEFVNQQPRIINYLPYPGNYGFIPQTIQSKKEGGDGDPLDIILLSESKPRGSIQKVKIIGTLYFLDHGETDHKIIALSTNNAFSDISNLSEMKLKHPEVIEIIKTWFENYKGKNKMKFIDYLSKKETIKMIQTSHKTFLQNQ